jgi:hypothetical protein
MCLLIGAIATIDHRGDAMSVTIDLPPEIEERLRSQTSDLAAELSEAAVVGLFREGKLSHFELSKVLGLDRCETDAYLKRHNIFEGSLTMEDLDADRATLERVFGKVEAK